MTELELLDRLQPYFNQWAAVKTSLDNFTRELQEVKQQLRDLSDDFKGMENWRTEVTTAERVRKETTIAVPQPQQQIAAAAAAPGSAWDLLRNPEIMKLLIFCGTLVLIAFALVLGGPGLLTAIQTFHPSAGAK